MSSLKRAMRREMPALLHLAMPLIAGELGWIAMSVVDTALLGRLPDSGLAMASAALAQVLFNTVCFGVGGVLLGLDSLISQAFGAEDVPAANRWLLHGTVMALALAAIQIVLFLFAPLLLTLVAAHEHIDANIVALAVPAMQGLNYGTLPLLLYFTLRRYLQAAHQTRPIAFALISANVLNLAGDWLLIFGHRWTMAGHAFAVPAFGVLGSSWSTSFARFYLMLVLIVALLRADRRHGYGLLASMRDQLARRIEWQRLLQLFRLGAPAGGQIFVEIAIFALVTTLIATFGKLPLAGHEVALQCASTTFMVPLAISAATSVRVGHAIGRMRIGTAAAVDVAAAGWSGVAAGAAFMLVMSVVLLTLPRHIARLFTPDTAVIAAAVPLLLIAAGFQFFDGMQITLTGALRGAASTTVAFLTQLVCYWFVGMPLGVWLAFRMHMGAAGLWLGLLIALGGGAVVLTFAWIQTMRELARDSATGAVSPASA